MGLPVILVWVFLLLLALALGSFLNVCIARLPQHRSIVAPRSCCPRCGAPIAARDNLPLVSWLLLAGRCRACRLPIAARYPLVELAYAALVAACVSRFGFTPAALSASVFCFLALGLLVMDLETMLLPDAFSLSGIALALLSTAALAPHPGTLAAVGATALSASLWALAALFLRWAYYAMRRTHGLGAGDVKLIAMLAAWLGNRNMAVTLFIAVVSAAAAGLALIAIHSMLHPGPSRPSQPHRSDSSWRTRQLPFGAFLCAAALYSLFFGSRTLMWYFSFWP